MLSYHSGSELFKMRHEASLQNSSHMERFYSYILSVELLAFGYILLKRNELRDIDNIGTIFLLCGLSALSGLIWRHSLLNNPVEHRLTIDDSWENQIYFFSADVFRIMFLAFSLYLFLLILFSGSALFGISISLNLAISFAILCIVIMHPIIKKYRTYVVSLAKHKWKSKNKKQQS